MLDYFRCAWLNVHMLKMLLATDAVPACVSMSVCGWVTSLTNLRTSPAHIMQGMIDSVHPWLTCGSGAASLWLGSFKTGVRPPECHHSTQNVGWMIISGVGQIWATKFLRINLNDLAHPSHQAFLLFWTIVVQTNRHLKDCWLLQERFFI